MHNRNHHEHGGHSPQIPGSKPNIKEVKACNRHRKRGRLWIEDTKTGGLPRPVAVSTGTLGKVRGRVRWEEGVESYEQ